jgi:hypothetical protein
MIAGGGPVIASWGRMDGRRRRPPDQRDHRAIGAAGVAGWMAGSITGASPPGWPSGQARESRSALPDERPA